MKRCLDCLWQKWPIFKPLILPSEFLLHCFRNFLIHHFLFYFRFKKFVFCFSCVSILFSMFLNLHLDFAISSYRLESSSWARKASISTVYCARRARAFSILVLFLGLVTSGPNSLSYGYFWESFYVPPSYCWVVFWGSPPFSRAFHPFSSPVLHHFHQFQTSGGASWYIDRYTTTRSSRGSCVRLIEFSTEEPLNRSASCFPSSSLVRVCRVTVLWGSDICWSSSSCRGIHLQIYSWGIPCCLGTRVHFFGSAPTSRSPARLNFAVDIWTSAWKYISVYSFFGVFTSADHNK